MALSCLGEVARRPARCVCGVGNCSICLVNSQAAVPVQQDRDTPSASLMIMDEINGSLAPDSGRESTRQVGTYCINEAGNSHYLHFSAPMQSPPLLPLALFPQGASATGDSDGVPLPSESPPPSLFWPRHAASWATSAGTPRRELLRGEGISARAGSASDEKRPHCKQAMYGPYVSALSERSPPHFWHALSQYIPDLLSGPGLGPQSELTGLDA
jgi:hypothetical protein